MDHSLVKSSLVFQDSYSCERHPYHLCMKYVRILISGSWRILALKENEDISHRGRGFDFQVM